jgi:hypothetical protein
LFASLKTIAAALLLEEGDAPILENLATSSIAESAKALDTSNGAAGLSVPIPTLPVPVIANDELFPATELLMLNVFTLTPEIPEL